MDDRVARLEQMFAQFLERDNREHRRPRRGYEPHDEYDEREDRHEGREERYDDRGLKLEIQDFDGTTGNPEVYLEWEKSMERYFEYKDTPDDRKFKLAKMKLVRSAGVWLEGVQKQRTREERTRISTWDKLKTKLRRRYVPPNYNQTLYIRLSSLKQEKESSVPHTIKTPRVGSSANSKSEVRKFEKGVPKRSEKVVVCPKCNGFGHLLKECSNKHAFTIDEWKEIRSRSTKKIWVVETENGVGELPEDEEEKRGEPTPPEIQKVVVDEEKLESIQQTPKEDVIHPKVRKFEAFETLFDPPKFLPEFMKRDIIDNVEATGILARASVNGVEETIFEDGEDVGGIDAIVPQRVGTMNGFGSFAFCGFDLNKIRGRIFLKKGRMNREWVQVMLVELDFGSSGSDIGCS